MKALSNTEGELKVYNCFFALTQPRNNNVGRSAIFFFFFFWMGGGERLKIGKMKLFNDTHRERLVFHSIQHRSGWLAASDLFHMFRQSIKFYIFHYQYSCLKNVIHQIDNKNGWLRLSSSLRQNLG